MPPRQQPRGEPPSKPLVPHPSLPVNPMTYRAPVSTAPAYVQMQATQGLPAMPGFVQQAPVMYAPTGMPMSGYMQPQGHYNPAMAFRQAIFQRPVYGVPTQTAEGYSYSATYLQQQQQQQQAQQFQPRPQPVATSSKVVLPTSNDSEPSRPNKRARPNPPSKPEPTDAATSTPGTALPTRTKIPLRKGQSEASQGFWRNCSSSGCTYVGPDKEVTVHEQDRHLIFKNKETPPGKAHDEDEEEAARKAGGPRPAIPGTSIRLETEEDIARWIAERKARWPTSSRVAQKEKERQEKIDRGELDPSADSRGNGRGDRGRGRGRGRERGRGGQRGGARGQSARGRDSGYGGRVGTRAGTGAEDATEDMGGVESDAASSDGTSSSERDDEEQDDDHKDETGIDRGNGGVEDDEDDEDDAPPESHDVRTRVAAIAHSHPDSDLPDSIVTPSSGHRVACRSFARTGKCKFGSKCRYEHVPNDKQDRKDHETEREPTPRGPVNPFARPSLLGAMLERPMRQTLLTLTEAIDFIVDNDFFDGVELVPGQAEEMNKALNRITEVDEGATVERVDG